MNIQNTLGMISEIKVIDHYIISSEGSPLKPYLFLRKNTKALRLRKILYQKMVKNKMG